MNSCYPDFRHGRDRALLEARRKAHWLRESLSSLLPEGFSDLARYALAETRVYLCSAQIRLTKSFHPKSSLAK